MKGFGLVWDKTLFNKQGQTVEYFRSPCNSMVPLWYRFIDEASVTPTIYPTDSIMSALSDELDQFLDRLFDERGELVKALAPVGECVRVQIYPEYPKDGVEKLRLDNLACSFKNSVANPFIIVATRSNRVRKRHVTDEDWASCYRACRGKVGGLLRCIKHTYRLEPASGELTMLDLKRAIRDNEGKIVTNRTTRLIVPNPFDKYEIYEDDPFTDVPLANLLSREDLLILTHVEEMIKAVDLKANRRPLFTLGLTNHLSQIRDRIREDLV